jgi:2-amino-4-hydroxy-6-hydroxymethyldihydropteridine diphosphokinase
MIHKNIFLLLGSNSGDRFSQLRTAIEFIGKEIGNVVATSKIYETAPWGKADQPHFLNQAIKIETLLSPNELLVKVQSIEQVLGRTRVEKWGERSIDIDVIYFADKIIDNSDLIIPHPHLAERRFVLIPLVEISPEFVHPMLQKSNAELLKECNDTLTVKEFIN